jgi:hypothetical protein
MLETSYTPNLQATHREKKGQAKAGRLKEIGNKIIK